MVRRCAVPHCKNVDTEILCHRFPKIIENMDKWIDNLNISNIYSKPVLAKKYVVCTIHFDKKDYKNELSNKLNSTAVPKLFGHIPRVSSKVISPDDIHEIIPQSQELLFCEDFSELTYLDEHLPHITDEVYMSDLICDPNVYIERTVEMIKIDDQPSESDIEILDFVENNQQNCEEYVSLISGNSDRSTSPAYEGTFRTIYIDRSCQVNPNELLENEQINKKINNHCTVDEDDKFQNFSRNELISFIKQQQTKITEMDFKLKEFEKAHCKLLRSMDAFQISINHQT